MTISPGKGRYIGSAYPGAEALAPLLERYTLATMQGMDPAEFLRRAEEWGSLAAYQRWLTAYQRRDGTFLDHVVWGADRDLGPLPGETERRYLYGAMDDRALTNLHRVAAGGGGLDPARHVAGKRCLVIGAWDGTECLLLHALGASWVDAIEEVPAFAAMCRMQLDAWQVPSAMVLARSLYEVDLADLWQSYDLLYVPGVLYHLSDPLVALVLCWGMLRPGGVLAFESIVDPPTSPPTTAARYLGALKGGWNWWAPTAAAYEAMLRDAGFPDARTVETSKGRGWWIGTKGEALPALDTGAAGISRPDLLRQIQDLLRSHQRSGP